jgi:hypothetical protein
MASDNQTDWLCTDCDGLTMSFSQHIRRSCICDWRTEGDITGCLAVRKQLGLMTTTGFESFPCTRLVTGVREGHFTERCKVWSGVFRTKVDNDLFFNFLMVVLSLVDDKYWQFIDRSILISGHSKSTKL